MRLSLPPTARVPTIALGCLVLFLVLSLFSASGAVDHGGSNMDTSHTSRRNARVYTVWDVDPGDQVHLSMGTSSSMEPAVPYLRILAVEGGEGDRLQTGVAPDHILFETDYRERKAGEFGAGRYAMLSERFTRPDIYDGKPRSTEQQKRVYDAVDLVLLVDRPAWMGDAQWAQVSAAADDIPSASLIVARQPWVGLQYVLYTGMAISLVVAVLGLVRFVRNHQSPPPLEPSRALADLVGLQATAVGFLRGLRSTMATAGAILAVGGAAGLVALNSNAGFSPGPPGYHPLGKVELGRDIIVSGFDAYLFLIMGLGWLTYFLALAVWFVQYRRINREYKRWTSAPNPLDD